MTEKELEKKKHIVRRSYDEAKKVVVKGNMFMLAIGLLIGASFGAVVTSLANDVIMAAIAKAFYVQGVENIVVNGIYIGKFLGALIQFIIVALFIFLALLLVYLIKNTIEYVKARKQKIEPEPIPEPTIEELTLAELKKLNENFKKFMPKEITKEHSEK